MTRFRLLAITPPTGPVPGDILLRWLTPARGEAPDLAVLLREPGRGPAELLASDRLADLRRRCREHGIPQLLSIDPGAPLPPLPPDIAGLHLRGDPDLAARGRVLQRVVEQVVEDDPQAAPIGAHGAKPLPSATERSVLPGSTPTTPGSWVR